MSGVQVFVLLPLIILAAFSVIIMLSIAVKRSYNTAFVLTLIGFAASFVSLFIVSDSIPQNISNLVVIDNFALFFMGLLIAASFAVVLISYSYLKRYEGNKEEYFILLLLSALGSSVLVCSVNFVTFFLGLEILSVSLYTLISYFRDYKKSIEAGIKYLILAGASSAFLLFGMALVYYSYGSLAFTGIAAGLQNIGINALVLAGFGMIIVGVSFKLALVPFHMWTPDVYEGAASPVTAFIASVSKGGMFAILLRFFFMVNGYQYDSLILAFSIIAIASMVIGNLLALFQNNVKRILAYSSISHLGYLLVAFIAGNNLAPEAVAFYLTAYFITIIGSFGIITVLSTKDGEAENIDDYKGLFWKKPVTAGVFTLMLFSLAGIPLTAGFIGKYIILTAGVGSTLWLLAIVLVVTSVIGLFYYLRVVTAMFSKSEESETGTQKINYSFSSSLALTVLTVLLIWFGVFPSGIIDLIKLMVKI